MQREIIRTSLARMGYVVEAVGSGEEALSRIARSAFDVLLVDIGLPGINGTDVLTRVREMNEDQCIILMTAEGSRTSAMDAIRAGADDYVTKPLRFDDGGLRLEVILWRSVERRRLAARNRELQTELLRSERLRAVMNLAGAAAHEMNQPLTVVMGGVYLLMRHSGLEDNDTLKSIQSAATELSQIINKLGQITQYHTKPYVGDTSILDLDRSTGSDTP